MRFLHAALLMSLSACAADDAAPTPVQPSAEDYAHAAASIAATVAHDGGEVAAMRQAFALARARDTAGFARTPDGAYVGTMAGLTYRYDITCGGATNLVPCTGASVVATWTGTTDQAALSLSLAHDATWQLSRMTDSIAHVDGAGHVDYQTQTFGSISSYAYDATYHVTIDDVRIVEGDMTLTLTGTHAGKGSPPYTLTATLTFLPDDTATLILDGTRTYQLALATGVATPQSAHPRE